MGVLDGKVAIVTGANSGIGLATAKRFVNEGAYVFITGRRQAELDSAVTLIGKNVTAVQGDVTQAQDLDRIAALVSKEKGLQCVLLYVHGLPSSKAAGFAQMCLALVSPIRRCLPIRLPAWATVRMW